MTREATEHREARSGADSGAILCAYYARRVGSTTRRERRDDRERRASAMAVEDFYRTLATSAS